MDNSLIKNKKILITGSNSRFAKALRNTFHGKNIIYTNRKELDILDLKSIDKCLDKNKPTHLIHLASLSRPMIVHEKDISSSIDANIIGTANIVKKCAERDIKLIFFSTNYIYPGTRGDYKEEDALKPINNYAWSKLGGESSVKLYKKSLVLRLCMTEYPFIHDKAFTDAKINFIYREEVIKMLPYLLDEYGIINVGSDITESVFDFAKRTKKDVKPISVKNIKDFPINSSVNINKLIHILKKKKQSVTNRKKIKVLSKKISKPVLSNRISVSQLEREIVDDMMRFGWDNFGYLNKFESEFAKFHKKKYCLLLPSYKITIYILLRILNFLKKNRVAISSLSNKFYLKTLGEFKIKKNLLKINKNDYSVNLNFLRKNINSKTKAIIFGDFFGNILNLDKIKKLCKNKKIMLIEDVSNNLGVKNHNIKSGTFGDITICDFSLGKTITCGEGGALLTNNKRVFDKAKEIRDGKNLTYQTKNHENLCFRPTNLQAAMIFGQFKRLNDLVLNKKKIIERYKKNFLNTDINVVGNNLIVIELKNINKSKINSLINNLKKNNIYLKEAIEPKKYFKRNFIIVPSNFDLKDEQVDYISQKIKFFLKIKK